MAAAARRLVVALVVLASCSGGGSSTGTTASAASTSNDAARETLPLVDEIYVAVKALETKLGAPQQFFEINATSSLVNLIVALNDGAVAQPWVDLDGELSSTEGSGATGATFASSALDFAPDKVLSKLQAALPQSRPDLFFIEGGPGGIVRYSVAVSSSQGGQFVVVVGPDGTVQSVDPG